ncbi:MAG: hypothetical protein LBJ73_02515 [Rickettsiales bacterium]|jgi:hypothetical protein|nr:hypothetical protein [Rickettsiales bacterium]
MKDERENNSNISLSAADGIPRVSFGTSSGDAAHLTPEDYSIAGNEFTAYYDGAHKLVFVLDGTVDSRKPNVLLVINPAGDRKWDDILANDYNADLETIRPKKDNKYQKLDIEYGGLGVYNRLINEYKSGADLTAALAELSDFRTASVRRAAADRLVAADEIIHRARETVSKTGETMRELQARLKKLREKLVRQKKQVGKEPTKQSAAKILKTESQIDMTNDRLKRAQKRLASARRRAAAAGEDAEIARGILGRKEEIIQATAPAEIKIEPSREEMAEEVKPLFDQNPEILDEKIAFKPIEFDAAPSQNAEPEPFGQEFERVGEPAFRPVDMPPAPLSFTPPPSAVQPAREETLYTAEGVRDTLPRVDYTDRGYPDTTPVVSSDPTNAPVLESITPVAPIESAPPIPDVGAGVMPEARPVSPISGTAVPLPSPGGARNKPAALYYIMLAILIVLSVFTLWLYQKKAGTTVPELAAPSPQAAAPAPIAEPKPAPATVVESPFIVESPVVETVIEPAPVVIEPEPIIVQSEVIEEYVDETPVPVQPEPVAEEPDMVIAEPAYNVSESVPAAAPAPEPVINKPAYNVGGERDEMFIADEGYESEHAVAGQPAIVCDDGTTPDPHGCCTGEIYTQSSDYGPVCCPISGGDCFPPL